MPAEEDIKLPEAKVSVVVKRIRKTDVAETQAQRVHKETGRFQGLEHDELALQVGRVWTGFNVEGGATGRFQRDEDLSYVMFFKDCSGRCVVHRLLEGSAPLEAGQLV